MTSCNFAPGLAMSPAQNQLYWREWGAVVRTCKTNGWPVPDRHDLHTQALGGDKSHLAFTNADFDLVLAQFRAISQPANLHAQLRAQDQPRLRMIWSIQHLAPPAYWQHIARAKFGTADLDALSLHQIHHLRITLAARARAKDSQSGDNLPGSRPDSDQAPAAASPPAGA